MQLSKKRWGRKWAAKTNATLRRFAAVIVTLVVTTHKNRWKRVAVAGRPSWDLRNQKIASFIPNGSSVIDLGCGAQTLRGHLPHGCEYQPCDLVKSSPDVILCDFNAELYPKVEKYFTHVVCSGVLEYIRDHHRFLNEISCLGGNIILSYNLRLPGDSKLQRMTNNWVNHFSQFDLEGIFRKAGLQSECLDRTQTGEVIFRLQQDNPSAQTQASTRTSGLGCMRIGCVVLTIGDHQATLAAKITCSDGQRELWYSLPRAHSDWFTADRCDGFVVGLLFQAMARNEDMLVEGPLSSRLFHSLQNFLIPMMAQAFPNLHPIKIIPSSLTSERAGGQNVGTGFSGGVDSFATVLQHQVTKTPTAQRITHFLFHNVGSHNNGSAKDARKLFWQRFEKVQPYPRELGIPIVPVDSNLAEIFPIDFIRMHSALNTSVPLVLQNQFQGYYYASTYKYADCGVNRTDDIARFDPLAFHLFSTEGLNCMSTGCQLSRVEKTALVAAYEPSRRHLNVCVDPAFEGRNCSVCFKCCRTLLTLELLGVAEHYKAVFDLEKFSRVRNWYILKVLCYKLGSFEAEIAGLFRASGGGVFARVFKLRHLWDKLTGWQ